jgi:acyl dehydratase
MVIDPERAKALTLSPITVQVERGRLQFFAQAIGESNPVYVDLTAARRAGHPDLPVPPTFFFSLELEPPDPFYYLAELGIDLRRILHGEQSFTYHSMVYAGDTVTMRRKIIDVYSKKRGALEFLVKKTEISRGAELVAESAFVIVVPNQRVAA